MDTTLPHGIEHTPIHLWGEYSLVLGVRYKARGDIAIVDCFREIEVPKLLVELMFVLLT